ncbi:LacI family DNA-binding transcriptional regulator [Leifsonia sp. NPDC058194]|uniref:LacI family DNA-binding transcriptional regulator n=1 Tax=Leifsonia sp. NPDC058194 TaxID=3346374 RepID=UPI0036DEE9E0
MTAELTPTRRPTSADVAKAAGVSRSTVSQILNGDERFPAATRTRVQAAAASLDYRPSRAGRALVTGQSDIVVVAVPDATFGPHLQDSVDRITRASALSGMSVVVRFGSHDDEDTLSSVLDLRPAAVVDFGVFSRAQRERLEAAGTAIVPRRPSAADGLDGVDADPVDIRIGRLQVAEVLRAGERGIVYAALQDRRLDPFGPPRLEGITRETAARGLPAPRTVRVPLDLEGALAALRPLLTDAAASPLGVCCYNDEVAFAVLAVATRLGLSVPQDVSLMGVDRIAVGQLITPRLTTVSVDQPALMDALVQDLVELRSPSEHDAPAVPFDPDRIVHLVRGETT